MADLAEQKKAVLPYLQVRGRGGSREGGRARAVIIVSFLSRKKKSSRHAATTKTKHATHAQRAEEVASVDPKVAYYCRMWAVDQVRSFDGLSRRRPTPKPDAIANAERAPTKT